MNFESTSSGSAGWSSLSKFLDCPKRAAIRYAASLARGGVPYDIYSEDEAKPVATAVGSIFGDLVEKWLAGERVDHKEEFFWNKVSIENSHKLTVAEARRLFEAYTKHYRPDHLGKVIATQVNIRIPESLLGLEVSGNLDLVVEDEKGRLGIVDIKTDGRNDKFLRMKYGVRAQKWWYALGYELLTGRKPDFVMIDLTIKNANPAFNKFEYEAMTEQRFRWLQDLAKQVKTAMANPMPVPNLGNCWEYSRPCQFHSNDLCEFI